MLWDANAWHVWNNLESFSIVSLIFKLLIILKAGVFSGWDLADSMEEAFSL